MANKLVKWKTDMYGEPIHKSDQMWHAVIVSADEEVSCCDHQILDKNEPDLEWDIKFRNAGGITCPDCIEMIKQYKAIKF